MRSRALAQFARVACLFSITALFVSAPIGCDEGPAKVTTEVGKLPPEATKANNAMEDFQKSKGATKK